MLCMRVTIVWNHMEYMAKSGIWLLENHYLFSWTYVHSWNNTYQQVTREGWSMAKHYRLSLTHQDEAIAVYSHQICIAVIQLLSWWVVGRAIQIWKLGEWCAWHGDVWKVGIINSWWNKSEMAIWQETSVITFMSSTCILTSKQLCNTYCLYLLTSWWCR